MASTTRRTFLGSSTAAGAAAVRGVKPDPDAIEIARRHPIVHTQATPDFFEGLLLGNGDLGLVITLRPDALCLHIGKNDSWDIRVSEEHAARILPFKEVLKLWRQASDEAKRRGDPNMLYLERKIDVLAEYSKLMHSSYDKPWPRPWPAGQVVLHWDSRMVTVVGERLDIADGVAAIDLLYDDLRGNVRPVRITAWVNQETNHICVRSSEISPVISVAYYPHIDAVNKLPDPEVRRSAGPGFAEFYGFQVFPATAPTAEAPDPPASPKDRSLAICGRLAGDWRQPPDTADPRLSVQGNMVANPARGFFSSARPQPLRLDICVFTSRDDADNVPLSRREAGRLAAIPGSQLQAASEKRWREFWSRSAVEIADRELERIWYRNQYFLACSLREGKIAPGLFGNWTSGKIGTSWHGDYHLDYNTQQIFWGVFASNHPEQHFPYVELIEQLQPMVKAIARDHFNLPGAFYPVSVYPVPSEVNPYPALPWFYLMCDAPWAVQSLWWHYLYTQDRDLLRRVYPMIADVARFMCGYMTREADGKYHIVPTVSAENWGCTVDFRLNKDAIMDLSLTEFVLRAAVEASTILNVDAGERGQWTEVLENMAPYPLAKGPYGEVWVDILNAPVEHVYNVPATTAPVFPGEQTGIGKRPELLEIAKRTTRLIRLEGGNDLVYQPLTRARVGMLDLGWFKREVRYALLPNGTAFDRVRQIGGRYRDTTDFDYMERMGIWVENLALPAVLNECMLQSWTGVIRLFPNTRNLGPAKFRTLRAAGAFLVSAGWTGKQVGPLVEIFSEKGGSCRVARPWPTGKVQVAARDTRRPVETTEAGEDVIRFETQPGTWYELRRG